MPDSIKHRINKPFMAHMPYTERVNEFKSYLWDCLTDTALMLNPLGAPPCQIVDHFNRMSSCGEFVPCIECGVSQAATRNTECAESTTAPETGQVTPVGGFDFT